MQSSKSSVGSNEEFAEVLRSSWIRRLHLKPTSSILKNRENPPSISPPPAAVNSPICNQTAISTDESRTPSSNFNSPTTPLPQRHNPSTRLDTIKCLFPGFGPFQLKNRATDSDKVAVSGREDDVHCPEDREENANSMNLRSFTGRSSVNDGRGTPLSPFFRYWPDSKKHESLRENTPSEDQNQFGTSPNTSSVSHPMCAPSLEALVRVGSHNSSRRCLSATTQIGGVYPHENCDNDAAASRILRDHQQNVVLSQLERTVSTNPNETGKASFWNMNRFRKAEVLSSMLHPCRSDTTTTSSKRKTLNSFDEFARAKYRKLGHED